MEEGSLDARFKLENGRKGRGQDRGGRKALLCDECESGRISTNKRPHRETSDFSFILL